MSGRWHRWLHRDCIKRELELLVDNDRRISQTLKLQREMGELRTQNDALTQSILLSRKQNMDSLYESLFIEQEMEPKTGHQFLTPVWAEREGEVEESA